MGYAKWNLSYVSCRWVYTMAVELPLLVSYMSKAKMLFELAEKAYGWAQQVANRTRNERVQKDALILATAGVLVASLRTLDNSFREMVGELRLFDADWSLERREQVIRQINHFADQELILPVIRQSLSQLKSLTSESDSNDNENIQKLTSCGRGVLAALGVSTVTPFHNPGELRDLLIAIKSAQTQQEVQSVVQQSDSALRAFDRNILADADNAFGQLKGDLLTRHHGALPDPGWAVNLRTFPG